MAFVDIASQCRRSFCHALQVTPYIVAIPCRRLIDGFLPIGGSHLHKPHCKPDVGIHHFTRMLGLYCLTMGARAVRSFSLKAVYHCSLYAFVGDIQRSTAKNCANRSGPTD